MRSLHRFLKTDRPFLMARKDGSKIIFRQDDTSRLLCHVRSGPHTETDIRSLEGPRIIDTVTSHYRHHASSMDRVDDADLRLRCASGYDERKFL